MSDVVVRVVDAPVYIKGYTLRDCDGDYNIYINAKYPAEQQVRIFGHELQHIRCGDYDSNADIRAIERD